MVADLPVELLTPILQAVHRNSRDNLIACMQGNKQFYELGFNILYRNVSLRLKDALRFRRAVEHYLVEDDKGRFHFPYTRCLRIVIPGDGRDYG